MLHLSLNIAERLIVVSVGLSPVSASLLLPINFYSFDQLQLASTLEGLIHFISELTMRFSIVLTAAAPLLANAAPLLATRVASNATVAVLSESQRSH